MKDILRKEMIGIEVSVISSKNRSEAGVTGKIIDETRNMLVIETSKGIKKIIKKNVTIRLKKEKGDIIINGELLAGRPEERIKKSKTKTTG